ncbi:phosphoribosylglycinamide synthetase C domain-containing protein, partial [Rothia kristinae]|uniref:phosphoribosylglycinamide synthetase C domain-containing protein n=1 Tax=Rothia kristinae TaxID=37923 RepID=UPI0033D53F79
RPDRAGQRRTMTDGARVLAVVALGEDLADARARAYAGVEAISWPGEQHRTDIARRAAEGRITIPAP